MRAFAKLYSSDAQGSQEQFQLHIALPFKLHMTVELTPQTTIKDILEMVIQLLRLISNTPKKKQNTI